MPASDAASEAMPSIRSPSEHDREDVVVLDLRAVALAQEALGHRHADAVGEALAQRPGGDLDARRLVDLVALGVARRLRLPLAEVLEVVHRDVVARQVQRRVQEHRAVAGAEHEAVAIGPVRIGRVVVHVAREEQVRRGRHRHRHARVSGVRLLDGVHGERADGVDAEAVDVCGHRSLVSRGPWLNRPISPGTRSSPTGTGCAWRESTKARALPSCSSTASRPGRTCGAR